MSEIPEDIRKAAREAFIEYANFSKHEAAEIAIRNVLLGGSDDMPMLELASRAIWAERQRCAEIVGIISVPASQAILKQTEG